MALPYILRPGQELEHPKGLCAAAHGFSADACAALRTAAAARPGSAGSRRPHLRLHSVHQESRLQQEDLIEGTLITDCRYEVFVNRRVRHTQPKILSRLQNFDLAPRVFLESDKLLPESSCAQDAGNDPGKQVLLDVTDEEQNNAAGHAAVETFGR
jgi:hypothetical protein